MFFASLNALAPAGLASFPALTLRASTIEQIDYSTIERLAERHMPWQRVLARAFQIYGSRKEAREMALLTQTPEERYRSFLLEHPQIAAQISQKDLAAYIRITPVALSRIKRRIKRPAL
jgi:CRP-like cAMP-binding protein